MEEMTSIYDLFDFAIEKEQEAHDFYMDLAGKMDNPSMKRVFEGFAREELGHKKKLELARDGKIDIMKDEKVPDLKISDYIVDVNPTKTMDYQGALILAMKKEKAAFRLYMDLSEMVDDPELSRLLIGIANEEARHKLRFEIEYDDHVLKWN
ncbi:rubrerythrin [Thermoplasmatales archaeon ex4484_6]|nr:MAG: rubrerythrin [Thermoplasmatales archaeon ex4484_6]